MKVDMTRREFMQASAMVAASAMLPAITRSESTTMPIDLPANKLPR